MSDQGNIKVTVDEVIKYYSNIIDGDNRNNLILTIANESLRKENNELKQQLSSLTATKKDPK